MSPDERRDLGPPGPRDDGHDHGWAGVIVWAAPRRVSPESNASNRNPYPNAYPNQPFFRLCPAMFAGVRI